MSKADADEEFASGKGRQPVGVPFRSGMAGRAGWRALRRKSGCVIMDGGANHHSGWRLSAIQAGAGESPSATNRGSAASRPTKRAIRAHRYMVPGLTEVESCCRVIDRQGCGEQTAVSPAYAVVTEGTEPRAGSLWRWRLY